MNILQHRFEEIPGGFMYFVRCSENPEIVASFPVKSMRHAWSDLGKVVAALRAEYEKHDAEFLEPFINELID